VTDTTPGEPLPNDPFTLEGIIAQEPVKPVWYRRGWVLVAAAVAVLVVASVLVDLPANTTPATDSADQVAVMKQINSAISGCSYATKETFTIYQDLQAHSLSAADVALTPSLLRDDQSACSFTSSSIYDLSNVEGTGTPAGKDITQVVNLATIWATSDALGAIEDIQTLSTHPGNASARADLEKRETALAQDRAKADGFVTSAGHILHTTLPKPDLPSLPTPTGS
jgi:hypothetical protein